LWTFSASASMNALNLLNVAMLFGLAFCYFY
jgi:hypothetical protein